MVDFVLILFNKVFILIDIAIPLGLIINELLTNSFKYAFANNENGTINISSNYFLQEANIKSSKKISLRYTDSGKGFDEEKILKSNTLGLRLLKLLSQQIGAKMTYSNQNGSEFIFTFSINL